MVYEFYKLFFSIFLLDKVGFSYFFFKDSDLFYSGLNTRTSLVTTPSKTIDEFSTVYRTEVYYNCVIALLKFWHILFIYAIFLYASISLFYKNSISFDVISLIHQNTIYMYMFSTIFYLFFFKNIFIFYFSNPFFFEKNINFGFFLQIFKELRFSFTIL